uniref:GATA-type domain-containing protein n=1 Tax=Arundo donax TaxID=35708 RepID=A0A0A9BZY8_ARUDO
MKKTPRAPAAAAGGKWRCQHCGAEKTPQWRVGPEGPGTLCNACGVRHRKGRLVPEYRRLKSPTFSSELHSNRHHRVVEMRRQREQSAAKVAAAVGADGGSRQVED